MQEETVFTLSQRRKLQLLLNIFLLLTPALIRTTVLILLVFAIFLLLCLTELT